MSNLPIRNIDDLRAEIYRLRGLEREQNVAIGLRFKNFSALMLTVRSLFPKSANAEGKGSGFFDQDLVGMISRFLLPFTLNKTIFRHSGFLVKTLVGLVSQKASHFITEDSVVSIWDKVKSLFSHKPAKSAIPVNKVVPPLSETY